MENIFEYISVLETEYNNILEDNRLENEKLNSVMNELDKKNEEIMQLKKELEDKNNQITFLEEILNEKEKKIMILSEKQPKRKQKLEKLVVKNIDDIISDENITPSPKKIPTMYGIPLFFGQKTNIWTTITEGYSSTINRDSLCSQIKFI